MKSTKKLKLTRESIRLLSKEALRDMRIVGGNSGQDSCAQGCEPSGIIACKQSQIFEECV
jgi:natural product precursor